MVRNNYVGIIGTVTSSGTVVNHDLTGSPVFIKLSSSPDYDGAADSRTGVRITGVQGGSLGGYAVPPGSGCAGGADYGAATRRSSAVGGRSPLDGPPVVLWDVSGGDPTTD